MLYDYLFGLCGGVTKPEDVPERLPPPIESTSASHTVDEDTPRSDAYSAGIQGYGAYEKIHREIEQENDKLVSVTDFKDSAFDISKQYGDLKLLKQQDNYGRGDDTGIVFSSSVLVGEEEEEEEGAPEPEDDDLNSEAGSVDTVPDEAFVVSGINKMHLKESGQAVQAYVKEYARHLAENGEMIAAYGPNGSMVEVLLKVSPKHTYLYLNVEARTGNSFSLKKRKRKIHLGEIAEVHLGANDELKRDLHAPFHAWDDSSLVIELRRTSECLCFTCETGPKQEGIKECLEILAKYRYQPEDVKEAVKNAMFEKMMSDLPPKRSLPPLGS